jgi:WD40 repeat protein
MRSCMTLPKIGYWDTFEGEAIRELEGSAGTIDSLAVTSDGSCCCVASGHIIREMLSMCCWYLIHAGEYFVSGGDDKILRVWDYDKGKCLYKGVADSGLIKSLALSPDNKNIVSGLCLLPRMHLHFLMCFSSVVSDEGAIYLWKVDFDAYKNRSPHNDALEARGSSPAPK